MRRTRVMLLAAGLAAGLIAAPWAMAQGQGRGQGGRGQAPAPAVDLPQNPKAVALPMVSAQVTGPGPMYDSTQSLAPGKGLGAFKYEAKEYFISGTANGQPYKTRLVVRKPANTSKFTGLVL